MRACKRRRERESPSGSAPRGWGKPLLLCAALFVATLLHVSPSAAACSFAAPVDFVGHAVVENLGSLKVRSNVDVTFHGVDIGADCSIGNEMDVSGSTVAVEVYHGVELYGLDGTRAGELGLGPSDYGFPKSYPRLDGTALYFVEIHDPSLNAMELGTGSRTVILPYFPAHDFRGYEVSDGRVAWVSFDGVYRFSIYDSAARTYVRENETFPGTLGGPPSGLELIAFQGDNLTLVRGGNELYAYDFRTGGAALLMSLPDGTSEVARDGPTVVFASSGTLYLHDLNGNSTRTLKEKFEGRNLELHGGVIVYDYHETLSGGPNGELALLALAGLVAAAAAASAGFLLLRRIRASGVT